MSYQNKTLALFACLALLLKPVSCGVMSPVSNVKDCKEHNIDLTCKTCKNGLVLLAGQGTCAPRDLACEDGRQLVFGQCLTITNCADRDPHGICRISSPPADPNCVSWDWDNQKCLSTVEERQGRRLSVLDFIPGCAEYFPDEFLCKNCWGRLVSLGDKCVTKITGCADYNSDG